MGALLAISLSLVCVVLLAAGWKSTRLVWFAIVTTAAVAFLMLLLSRRLDESGAYLIAFALLIVGPLSVTAAALRLPIAQRSRVWGTALAVLGFFVGIVCWLTIAVNVRAISP